MTKEERDALLNRAATEPEFLQELLMNPKAAIEKAAPNIQLSEEELEQLWQGCEQLRKEMGLKAPGVAPFTVTGAVNVGPDPDER